MASPPLLSSYMEAPIDPQQDDHLLLSPDRNFALHGEIMMFVFLLLFAAFLSVLLFVFYKKRCGCSDNANRQDFYSSEPLSLNKLSYVQPKTQFPKQ
ncbi:hypothetical protein Golax_002483 [Gossypium laxum]|uniref:Uncharacterized protein n=1 Tax=Gossypium laxum TaxID=34288 RepID=A0A7J9ARX1_9ROSI|nr:hypothetical protein [Gossypium laxum]